MRPLLIALILLTAAGCTDQAAVAEANARTAEAEARRAEAEAQTEIARNTPPPVALPDPMPEPRPVQDPRPAPRTEPAALDYVPFGTPQTAVVQTQSEGRITLRAEARAGARHVARVADGTRVRVLGCQDQARVRTDAAAAGTPGRWCYVRAPAGDGWAFDAYLVF